MFRKLQSIKRNGCHHQKGGECEDKLPMCFDEDKPIDEDKLNNDMIKEGKRNNA